MAWRSVSAYCQFHGQWLLVSGSLSELGAGQPILSLSSTWAAAMAPFLWAHFWMPVLGPSGPNAQAASWGAQSNTSSFVCPWTRGLSVAVALSFCFSLQVCLIGRTRTYPSEEEVDIDEQRTQYIHSRKGCPTPDTALDTAGRWLSGFQPREKVERVRNGATLPRELTERVVLQVAQLLLDRAQGHSTAWNPGGKYLHLIPPPTPLC